MWLAVADDGTVTCAALGANFHEGTDFASLWGGSTLTEYRGRGIYKALVARRADEAAERGFRYLQVERPRTAGPSSSGSACAPSPRPRRGTAAAVLTCAVACTEHVASRMSERVVVVGADAAGMSAASQAKRLRGDDLEVVALERSQYASYSACGIPYWVGGEVGSVDDLVARTPAEHRANGIDLRMRAEAMAIDLDRREVEVRDHADEHDVPARLRPARDRDRCQAPAARA